MCYKFLITIMAIVSQWQWSFEEFIIPINVKWPTNRITFDILQLWVLKVHIKAKKDH